MTNRIGLDGLEGSDSVVASVLMVSFTGLTYISLSRGVPVRDQSLQNECVRGGAFLPLLPGDAELVGDKRLLNLVPDRIQHAWQACITSDIVIFER